MSTIAVAATEAEIQGCQAVLAELRSPFEPGAYLERIRRQQAAGYQLVFLADQGEVQAVAGFRVAECLAWGRFLYVDDLVTAAPSRSKGYGRRLLAWLMAEARRRGCGEFHLDSGIQRVDAHRFYERDGLSVTCLHFARKL
jgi:GNAT superfamily N-acetyltransferase